MVDEAASESVPPDRLRIVDLGLDLARQLEAAELRQRGWTALGSGVALLYLILTATPGRGFGIADILVLAVIAGATLILVQLERQRARECRDLIGSLLAPSQFIPPVQS